MLKQIGTPALLVDRKIVEANTIAMRLKAQASGVALRPHVKTHKTLEIARMQLGQATGPIAVSTLAEAEFYADHGFTDITYAVPVVATKLARAAAIAKRIERFNLILDHQDMLSAVEEFAAAHSLEVSLFLEVDCGYHRSGADPALSASFELARRMAGSKNIRFQGLLTHAGHSYHASGKPEAARIAAQEITTVVDFAAKLGEAGVRCPVLSIGSTPTCMAAETFRGATEIRPGNYVFFDAFQVAIGSCRLQDCAATVLSSVLGVYPQENRMILDAGALALSKDAGADHLGGRPGFGIVCDLDLEPLPLDLYALSQEHGHVRGRQKDSVASWKVGDRVRIVPNHSCLTAAMFDRYAVLDEGKIVDEWRPVRGW